MYQISRPLCFCLCRLCYPLAPKNNVFSAFCSSQITILSHPKNTQKSKKEKKTMTSLQQLLSDDGFTRDANKKLTNNHKKVRFKHKKNNNPDQLLPIYICHDRTSFENKPESKTGSSVFSSGRSASSLGEPLIDQVAIRAVVSILSGYVSRYLKDGNFRQSIRKKCYSVFETGENRGSGSAILVNLELGIESIEKLVGDNEERTEMRIKLLRNSIRLLTIVAALNSKTTKNGSTCGVLNTHLSACAQLYLSIVYKIEKNERNSSKHLLQVFCDSPFLARNHLLPDLWEHFFLPHLLHLKIWYTKEIESLSELGFEHNEKKLKGLSKVYDEQMDLGTAKFALYYKDWLRVGSQSPSVPTIPLPSMPGHKSSRRFSSDSLTPHSSINKSLYRTVFGPTHLQGRSLDFDNKTQASTNRWDLEAQKVSIHENNHIENEYAQPLQHRIGAHRRSLSQSYRSPKVEKWPEAEKSDRICFFSCRSELTHIGPHGSVRRIEKRKHFPNDFTKAATFISSSDSLSECELAIRVIIKTWLDLNGDVNIEKALSKAPIIKGMLGVLFTSNDDEILELTISILAELAMRNEANGHIIINSDPQLELFMRLLRSSSLFLKAAILLYLVKPTAKQMISIEWVPLVLRVLQFGDQLQTLLSIRCHPHVAAYYFLDLVVTGFDQDKNLENARQVVNMGGLGVLVKRFEVVNVEEKAKAVSVICCCIRADGGCRHYLAANLNKGSIVELLVLGKPKSVQWLGLKLLTELLCLNRRTELLRFLNELLNGWGNLNTMHILFTYLQKADLEERPVVAALLLQLDLLGDPMKCSVYREEAVDAIIEGLDCDKCDEKVQELVARVLSILGGRFSYKGEATTERLILEESGFHDKFEHSFRGKDVVVADLMHLNVEEDEAMQNWQRNTAIALLTCGTKRFLSSLCNCIANSIPCLARASLVTIAWTSCYLCRIADQHLQSTMCSVLVPHLAQSLDHDRAIEERVLVSFALLSLTKCAGFWSVISPENERLSSYLRDLSKVTWTARELISVIREISTQGSVSRA